MYLPFQSLPNHSRVWVYQSNRSFSSSEKNELEMGLRSLCDQWAAHGNPLHTSFAIILDQFVVMAVDEKQLGASGCSIDSSIRYLKSLQTELNLDFFDRKAVAFFENERVALHSLAELKTLFANQTLSAASITLNNLVATKEELTSHWKVAVKDSWMAKYLPKTAVPIYKR